MPHACHGRGAAMEQLGRKPVYYLICLALVLLPLLLEGHRLRQLRGRIPLRIHVHGSRGKSSLTRKIAELLRQQGYTVLAKTTGDAPEYILPDGTICPIKRYGPARIQEHETLLSLAAHMKANAVVVEGMALQPETVWESEKILQATHAVITNVRPDHRETMGSGKKGVIQTLGLMIPPGGKLYTAQESGVGGLRVYAHNRGASCTVVATPSLLEQAEPLAKALCSDIFGEIQLGTLGSINKSAVSDKLPTPLIVGKSMSLSYGRLSFYDLFSANDVVSSQLLWRCQRGSLDDNVWKIALLATRADRPLRTVDFMEWIGQDSSFDLIVPVGGHAWHACLHGRVSGGKASQRLLVLPNPWLQPKALLKKLFAMAQSRGKSHIALVGLGNSHGAGIGWRTFLDKDIFGGVE